MENASEYDLLMHAYLKGNATPAQVHKLFNFIRDAPVEAEREPLPQSLSERMLARLMASVHQAPVVALEPARPVRRIWIGWAAAAVVILMSVAASFYLVNQPDTARHTQLASGEYKTDVQPGHSGAILQLSDGSTVTLDSAANGTVAVQGTAQVIKTGGELKYIGQSAETLFNTITTAPGRQWQLVLSDGTKVWLNAASSIRYPLAFRGGSRTVEITGEAYFEVVHNEKQPFRVQVGDHLVEDVGTAFNINAYANEPEIKTTLVEGAIRLLNTRNATAGKPVILKPGQQATIKNGTIAVAAANVEQALAWKNGYFSFENADIHTVMRQLARWYDVSVEFQGQVDPTPFQGNIGRGLTLAQVLKLLEQLHIHFRIEKDKRIIILP